MPTKLSELWGQSPKLLAGTPERVAVLTIATATDRTLGLPQHVWVNSHKFTSGFDTKPTRTLYSFVAFVMIGVATKDLIDAIVGRKSVLLQSSQKHASAVEVQSSRDQFISREQEFGSCMHAHGALGCWPTLRRQAATRAGRWVAC